MNRLFTALALTLALIPGAAFAADIRSVTMKPATPKGSDQDIDRLLLDRNLKLAQIILRNGKTMERHSVSDTATIHCVSGNGVLIGDDGKRVPLRPGVVIILAPDTPHAIQATPELSLLLTRFGKP